MNKEHILAEIKRTAALNGGVPLGIGRFFQETGIKDSDWKGKLWARWGDAVKEAGLTPNTLQVPYKDEELLERYATYIREIGHIPVKDEISLKGRQDQTFPSPNTFKRFGNKQQLLKKLAEYCKTTPGYEDVLALILQVCNEADDAHAEQVDSTEEEIGFVYMLKAGRHFKIGRSNSFDRRSRELKIQLPEQAETVHVIRTDDPVGIEAYWHRRFESKRKNGEWFELNAQDVKAFKRRKFM
jgi:hypothetical protein